METNTTQQGLEIVILHKVIPKHYSSLMKREPLRNDV